MQIINDLNVITKPYHNAVVTTGNFDGVHLGHQALFHEVIERADAIDGTDEAPCDVVNGSLRIAQRFLSVCPLLGPWPRRKVTS